MRTGFGVFLIVVGAILAFAVKKSFEAFDLTMIGYILMAAGALLAVIGMLSWMPRTRRARSTAVTTDAYGQQVVTERDDRISGL
ncbi:hypothetical protein D1871_13580 [Nakamurella silvestris]|nr:hypothetical protein D1871_13580 [Nakamurella silvestris]